MVHFQRGHMSDHIEAYGDLPACGAAAANTAVQSVISKGGVTWPPGNRDQLTRKVANWLCKHARPLSLPERDTELKDVLSFASDGGYSLPAAQNVVRHLCALSGKVLANDRRKVSSLRAAGVDPSAENGIARLGILLYFWAGGGTELGETLVRAVHFGDVAHTGDATKKALASLGIGECSVRESESKNPKRTPTALSTQCESACTKQSLTKKALQMFDAESLQLNLSTDDSGSTSYREFQLDLLAWQVIEQSVRVTSVV
ncbi:hypothetical protein CYMTET_14912 [Cymbomonas tetramitiformis]|uniref:Uncharacterized protein n=1 Tax=Cymbomonas tetramitiformis TaxID=36881 RepID=A0AAE0GFE5_9CHLO|nr:hypothetical protein CYMTET_14912 [Cymbomonas tetramitiformis]